MSENHVEGVDWDIPSAFVEPSGEFTLSPMGSGRILEVLHRGTCFDTYRAELNDSEVCLKVVSPTAKLRNCFHGDWSLREGSECFSSGAILCAAGDSALGDGKPENTPTPSDMQILTQFLGVERQIIDSTKGAWNHSVLGQGVLQNASDIAGEYYIPEHLRFVSVTVMPYYPAKPMSRLANEEARELFPRMMPALWDALCASVHGDLSEENILIDADRRLLRIIDPGVMLTYGMTEEVPHAWLPYESRRETRRSLFVTNRANYPILPPFHEYPTTMTRTRFRKSSSGQLDYNHVDDVPLAATPLLAQVRLLASHATHAAQWPPSFVAPKPWNQPHSSDLFALGLMYFRLLTGRELVLGELLEEPAWLGELPATGRAREYLPNDVGNAFRRVDEALTAGYLESKLQQAIDADSFGVRRIQKPEAHLLRSLLTLTCTRESMVTVLGS